MNDKKNQHYLKARNGIHDISTASAKALTTPASSRCSLRRRKVNFISPAEVSIYMYSNSDKRAAAIITAYQEHPSIYRQQYRQDIERATVSAGMNPVEAAMAGGAFSYKLNADPAVWPINSDPMKVMWTLASVVDKTEAWMIFKNATQFNDGSVHRFTAYVAQGLVQNIADNGRENENTSGGA